MSAVFRIHLLLSFKIKCHSERSEESLASFAQREMSPQVTEGLQIPKDSSA